MKPVDRTPTHLPYPLFDSHFHAGHMLRRMADDSLTRPVESVLTDIFQAGLVGALEVAVDEDEFIQRTELSDRYPGICLAAGIHPSSTHPERGEWSDRFSRILEQVQHRSVVAIGETGLDYFRNHSPAEVQERAFSDHLNLAADTGLPVIIHNRNADERVLRLLKNSDCRRGVFHCFSSGPEIAEKALELGFCISFAGNITYKKSEEMREALRIVPRDRILLETDSPYLSPQPVRKQVNHPGNIGYTLETVAEVLGEDPSSVARWSVANARRLFLERSVG